MQYLRVALIIILIPVYLVTGGFLSSFLQSISGVWDHYFAAVILPAIGLLSTWAIAPWNKMFFTCSVYIIGMILARLVAFPAFYPEVHPLAYQATYTPFIITLVWSTFLTIFIFIYEHRKSYNQQRQHRPAGWTR